MNIERCLICSGGTSVRCAPFSSLDSRFIINFHINFHFKKQHNIKIHLKKRLAGTWLDSIYGIHILAGTFVIICGFKHAFMIIYGYLWSLVKPIWIRDDWGIELAPRWTSLRPSWHAQARCWNRPLGTFSCKNFWRIKVTNKVT